LALTLEEQAIRFDKARNALSLDRTKSGKVDFNVKFTGAYEAPLRASTKSLRLRLDIDTCSVEIFANDGESVLTALVFPEGKAEPVQLRASNSTRVKRLTAPN
jgi:fructan beta-fructosidase